MMNHPKLSLVVLIVALGAVSCVQSISDGQSNSNESRVIDQDSAVARFSMANLFNFEQYQKLFNKHYKSFTEKALRAKMYLARAFRAFISMVAYKHRESSMYLSVNRMSDWTQAEIENILLRDEKPIATGDTNSKTDIGSDESQSEPILAKISEPRGISSPEQNSNLSPAKTADPFVDLFHHVANRLGYSGDNMNSFTDPYNQVYHNSVTLPDATYIDHRYCLPEAEWQGSCGSCYAFASMALYEWAYCRAKNKLISFSKQYVVDCGEPGKYIYGCNGGSPIYVRDFVLNNGLLREDEYKYKDKKSDCSYPDWVSADLRGSVRIYDTGSEFMSIATVEEKLKIAPLVMLVGFDPECSKLIEYGGGVDNAIDCKGRPDMSHAMLLVGTGREDGHEYFLLRNSFGTQWGEEGYYKMNKRHSSIIDKEGLVIKFADLPVVDEGVPGESAAEKERRNHFMKLQMYQNIIKGLDLPGYQSGDKQ